MLQGTKIKICGETLFYVPTFLLKKNLASLFYPLLLLLSGRSYCRLCRNRSRWKSDFQFCLNLELFSTVSYKTKTKSNYSNQSQVSDPNNTINQSEFKANACKLKASSTGMRVRVRHDELLQVVSKQVKFSALKLRFRRLVLSKIWMFESFQSLGGVEWCWFGEVESLLLDLHGIYSFSASAAKIW